MATCEHSLYHTRHSRCYTQLLVTVSELRPHPERPDVAERPPPLAGGEGVVSYDDTDSTVVLAGLGLATGVADRAVPMQHSNVRGIWVAHPARTMPRVDLLQGAVEDLSSRLGQLVAVLRPMEGPASRTGREDLRHVRHRTPLRGNTPEDPNRSSDLSRNVRRPGLRGSGDRVWRP